MGSYACSGDPGWNSGQGTFEDPLPVGAVISSVMVEIPGSFHCTDAITRTASLVISLNGVLLGSTSHTGGQDCICGQCSGSVNTTASSSAIKAYGYRSHNVISVDVNGDQVCFGVYKMTFSYSIDYNTIPPYMCCRYKEAGGDEITSITCVQTGTGCSPQSGRTYVESPFASD